jgi:hypothetical protein
MKSSDLTVSVICDIAGSHSNEIEHYGLPGFDAV